MVQVTWPRWPPCPYMVKTFKNLLLQNQKSYDLETWHVCWSPPAWFRCHLDKVQVTTVYHQRVCVYIFSVMWSPPAWFRCRFHKVLVTTVYHQRDCVYIFSVISSPEPSGSQGELIVYPYSGVRCRPLSSSSTMFKHLLLWNRFANQSQILCGASLGRGNESLYKWSRSHDQDGRHAHIWEKPLKIFFSRTRSPMILKLGM